MADELAVVKNRFQIQKLEIEIYNKGSLGFIIGQLVYRHSERNAVSDYADLLEVNWLFHCPHWNT